MSDDVRSRTLFAVPARKHQGVLRTLFSMSDFHEILLEGLGFTPLRPFSRSLPTAPRGEEEAEPPAKRARRIWAILRPPSEPSPLEGLTASWASAPPKVSRYGQATLPEVAGMAVPGAAPMSSEKRKRLQHSEVARYLWGKDVRVKGEKRYLQMRCVVRAPISSKKRWSGKSPPSASELSLRAEQPFVLYEYIEESPVLLMNMGMGHEVFSYFVPRKKRYEGELLGPLRYRPTDKHVCVISNSRNKGLYIKPFKGRNRTKDWNQTKGNTWKTETGKKNIILLKKTCFLECQVPSHSTQWTRATLGVTDSSQGRSQRLGDGIQPPSGSSPLPRGHRQSSFLVDLERRG